MKNAPEWSLEMKPKPTQIMFRKTVPYLVLCTLALFLLAGGTAMAQSISPSPGGSASDRLGHALQWRDISPGWLQTTSPMQVTFQPGSPQRILLGTVTEGLLDSLDHGATWTQHYWDFYISGNIPSTWISDVIFNPANPQDGLAITMSGSYYSLDGGFTWTRHPGSLMPTTGYMLANSPDGMYAFATELFGSLFRYDWSAAAWDTELTVHYNLGLYGLTFDRSSPAKLYMGSELYDVAVSTDLGKSFYSFGEGLSGPVIPIAADPVIPDRVLAASDSELFIKYEAKSRRPVWFPYGNGLPGTTIHVLLHDPRDPNRIFAGLQDEGVYVSLDRGLNWSPMTKRGLGHTTVIDLAINPENPGYLIASAHNGTPAEGGLYMIRILPPAKR